MPKKYKGQPQKGETSGKVPKKKPGAREITLQAGDNPSAIAAQYYAKNFGGDEKAAQRYAAALKRANPGSWQIGRKINLPKFDKGELNIPAAEWAALTGGKAPAAKPTYKGPAAAAAAAPSPAVLASPASSPPIQPGYYPAPAMPTPQQMAAPGSYLMPSQMQQPQQPSPYQPAGYVPFTGSPYAPPGPAPAPGAMRYRMPTQMQGQNVNASGYNLPLPSFDWSAMMQPAGPGPMMQSSPFGSTPPGGLNTPGVPFRGANFTPPTQTPWWKWRLGMMNRR